MQHQAEFLSYSESRSTAEIRKDEHEIVLNGQTVHIFVSFCAFSILTVSCFVIATGLVVVFHERKKKVKCKY